MARPGRRRDASRPNSPNCAQRGEVALIPYIVAGDPDLDRTARLVLELEARGADLIELGVPFSDPDGRWSRESAGRRPRPRVGRGAFPPSSRWWLSCASTRRSRWCCSATTIRFITTAMRGSVRTRPRRESTGLLVVDLPPEEARELAVSRARIKARHHLFAGAHHAARTQPRDRALRHRIPLFRRRDWRDWRARAAAVRP